jgi:hypothetical protein
MPSRIAFGTAYGIKKDQQNISSLKNWALSTTYNLSDALSFNDEYVKSR